MNWSIALIIVFRWILINHLCIIHFQTVKIAFVCCTMKEVLPTPAMGIMNLLVCNLIEIPIVGTVFLVTALREDMNEA